jgi:GNAT superfamily N-acetyltransferase
MTEMSAPDVSTPIVVRSVPVDVVRPLRHRVLRPGWPEESVHSDHDDADDTVHLAAFAGDDVIGVVTMFPQPLADDPRAAERFRWMAVDETWRGSGAGQALMRHAASLAGESGFQLMWAHGRDTALGFYVKLGFRVVGEGYLDAVTRLRHHVVVIETAALIET